MSRKVQKRIKETSTIYESAVHSSIEAFASNTKSDESLFTVDRTGSKGVKKRILKEILPISCGKFISETEKKLIQKRIKSEVKKPYAKFYTSNKSVEINNLWENHLDDTDSSKNCTKLRNLRVALPGQSYNPAEDDHQNALAEAIALQLKKEDVSNAQQQHNAIQTDNTDFIQSEAVENIDNSDYEEIDNNTICLNIKSKKPNVKFTKAQRNKIRAKNIANFEKSKQLTDEQILNSINLLPKILSDIEEKEQLVNNDNDHKQVNCSSNKVSLTYYDVGTVPLSDELSGSLRQVIPKGLGLLERESTMKQLGDLNTKNQRSRRAYEKPHGPKRIVWVAKYKYV